MVYLILLALILFTVFLLEDYTATNTKLINEINRHKVNEGDLNNKLTKLMIENNQLTTKFNEVAEGNKVLLFKLDSEIKNNEKVVSQSKSSQVKTGQLTEQILPFLDQCPFKPRDMHFLGAPVDYLVVDFDQAEIHFVECKTGNSQESKRQKIIKNIIKSGKVYYTQIRVNEKGIKSKKAENVG